MNRQVPLESTWTDYHPFEWGPPAVYNAPYEPSNNTVGVGEADAAEYYQEVDPRVRIAYGLLSTAGLGLGAYHGYKRTGSYGWAVGWSIFGAFLPILALPIMVAQGFGDKKGR